MNNLLPKLRETLRFVNLHFPIRLARETGRCAGRAFNQFQTEFLLAQVLVLLEKVIQQDPNHIEAYMEMRRHMAEGRLDLICSSWCPYRLGEHVDVAYPPPQSEEFYANRELQHSHQLLGQVDR